MSSWHYRVAYRDVDDGIGGTERIYGMVEFYDGLGAWTDFITPSGETIQELRNDLQMMLNDITHRDEEPLNLSDEAERRE